MSGRAHGARIVAKLREAAEKGSFSSSVSTILNRCVNKIATYPSTVSSQSRNVIFANNYLNMGDIKVMGFDLDYTLVSYTVELQSLIFTLARNVLVNIYGYPRDLMASQFDPHFAIRGLSVDSQSGVLCKLSHLQRVSAKFAYKGKKPLSSEMVEKLYGESRHIAHGDLKKMRPLNDMFSLAEGCLIAEVIELFEHNKTHRAEEYEPAMLINDIQEAIRDVHVSGTMHEMVSKDCERYINVNKKLPDMLQRLINADKKLFLCTNSGYNFANKALSYSLGLRPDSIAAEEWHHYFDVIICSAHKPDFYFSKRPFRKWNIPTSTSGFTPVGKVEKGSVYINGSLRALVNTTGWKGKVLYIGDNLKADLVEACRWHGWHTACIINELEQEIDVQNTSDFQYLHLLRSSMRSLMIDLQQKTEEEKEVPQRDSTYILLDCIEKELKVINNSLSISFNPQFGSIFRTDGHPSLFSFAVRRYADLYTSDVCNFANYDPSHRFYPSRSIRMVRYKYDDCWSTHVFAYSSGDLAWFIDWFSATVCYRTISYRIFI